jgi:hypothetical protein
MMVLVALSAVGIGLSRRPWVEGFELRDEKVFWLLFLLLEVVSFATTGRYYGHYFIPFCVIAAYGYPISPIIWAFWGRVTRVGVTSRAWLFVILLPLILGHGSALKDQVRQSVLGVGPRRNAMSGCRAICRPGRSGDVTSGVRKPRRIGSETYTGWAVYPYMTPLVTEG